MPAKQLSCPSNYDKPITYRCKETRTDSYGANVATRVDQVKSYGSVETGNGTEVYRARQVVAQTNAVVKLPYNSRTAVINSSGQFVINGKNYEILFVVNVDEDNSELMCGCRYEG